MRAEIHQLSAQGGREDNEDRIAHCRTSSAGLLVLADGMGGYEAGEVAAEIAVRTYSEAFSALAQPVIEEPGAFLQQTLLRANRAIVDYARSAGMREQPRTTLVAALLQHRHLWGIHAGDSRLYWLRQAALCGRTRDHTHQDQPHLSAVADAANRNLLFSCLGLENAPLFDTLGPFLLEPGDRLLLCSDGLWSAFDDAELAQMFSSAHLGEAVPVAVRTALERAGAMSDNVTLLALEWEPLSSQKTEFETTTDVFDPEHLKRTLLETHTALARTAQRTLARKPST